jgi:subtilisin-like proprotein convertase family protein
VTLYGIRGTAQTELIRFDHDTPGTVTSLGNLSGLQAGERITGMDYSPFLGSVFATGSSSRVYKINLNTAQAIAVSNTPFTPGATTNGGYGFECDRASNQAHLLRGGASLQQRNAQLNLSSGQVTANNTNPSTNVLGLAQSLSGPSSTYFGISHSGDLVSTNDITTGSFSTVGATGLGQSSGSPSGEIGFDIAPDGRAFLSYRSSSVASGATQLYEVVLTSGVAIANGTIGDGTQAVGSLTAAPIPPSGQITINNSGAASPYPSVLQVSGYANVPLSRVRVRLNGLSHTFADDINVLLVGPQGHSTLLMADSGGGGANNLNLLFDDAAPNGLPDNSALSSGTFKPTSHGNGLISSLPAPAPPAPYTASLGVFKGTNPNGDWKLFVFDDFNSGHGGQIAEGWTLLLDQEPSIYNLSAPTFSVAEGAGSLTVTVNRTGNISGPGSVNFLLNSGSAVAGDFVAASGTINFAAGEASKNVVIGITNDALAEGDEQFSIALGASTSSGFLGQIGANSVANITIVDDDALPVITVASTSIAEGAPGTNALATFSATLDKPAPLPVTFKYAIAAGEGDVVAASGTAAFAVGSTSTSFTLNAVGDSVLESDETFAVTLSDPSNATLAATSATLTLQNDDAAPGAPPTLSLGSAAVAEGGFNTFTDATFTATLSAPSAAPVSVSYAIAPGDDYIESSGTLFFAPGATSATFSIKVKGDTVPEPNETFPVTLSAPQNATLGLASGTLTITNDDLPVSIASFSPGAGKVGANVVITGTNFDGARVFFNGVLAPSVTLAPDKISTFVPKGATTGPIRVEAFGGVASSTVPFKVLPVLSSALAPSGAAGTNFFVSGDSLEAVSSVKINGVAAPFARISPTLLRITVPPTATSGFISVTSPAGVATSTFRFTVLPVVTSFTPARAAVGTRVVIKGSGFTLVRQVLFGTGAASAVTANSPTQITATVPASATNGPITVVTAAGRAPSRTSFAVLLSTGAFSPARGAAGTAVTINGSGFVGIRNVFFNGVPTTSFRIVSASQIVATVPARTTTGRIRIVSAANGEATTAGIFTVVSAAGS